MSPAEQTSTSGGPSASAAALTNAWTEASSLTSSSAATASPPSELILEASRWHASSRLDPRATGNRPAASASAEAAPMPDDAPAINAGRRSGCGSKSATSARLHPDRQAGETPDADRVHALCAALVDLVPPDHRGELAQCDRCLEPGQVRSETVVPSRAEADQRGRVAVKVVAVGVTEGARVPVGRADQQQQPVARRDNLLVRLEVRGDGPGDELAGRVVAERLLDPVG